MHPSRCFPFLLALAWVAPPASADLWRWQDAAGVVRYTPDPARVPSGQRGSLVRVEPGMPPVAAPAPTPAAPATATSPELYAPADEFSFTADPFNAPEQARTLRGEQILEPPMTGTPDAAAGEVAPTPSEVALPPAAPTPSEVALPPAAPTPSEVTLPPATPTPTPSDVELPPAAPLPSAAAPAAATPPVAAPPPLGPAQRSRKAELEELIRRDEEALKLLISADADASEPSEELREIARRLPELQAELRALEGREPAASGTRAP